MSEGMDERMDERQLLERLAGLPREIQPANDVWPAISARIAGRPAGSRRIPFAALAIAASAVLAVAVGLVLGPRWASGPTAAQPAVAVTAPASEAAAEPLLRTRKPLWSTRETGATNQTLAASEAEYQAAFREFIGLGESQRNLSPATVQTIESSWAELQETERALQEALAANPDNRFLNQRMLELRARQLGFLKQLAALEQTTWRLTI